MSLGCSSGAALVVRRRRQLAAMKLTRSSGWPLGHAAVASRRRGLGKGTGPCARAAWSSHAEEVVRGRAASYGLLWLDPERAIEPLELLEAQLGADITVCGGELGMSGRAADEHRILDTAGDDAAGERRACGERTTDQTPTVARHGCPEGSAPCAWSEGTKKPSVWRAFVARPERFELPTFGSVDRRSIQLSYGREVAKCSREDPRARRPAQTPDRRELRPAPGPISTSKQRRGRDSNPR